MATERSPNEEPAATLRIVAPTETAAPRSDWTGRVGALSALARPAAFQRGARLLSYAVLGALIGVAVLVAAATLPVLFGYHTYVVEGGSMGSSLKTGSVAVSKPTSPYALEIGDIIARRSSRDSPPILHRIVDIIIEDGQRAFVTQGDVNRTPDPQPIALDGPGDKVVYSVPYAGYILHYVGSGLGRLLLIGTPLALLGAILVREKWPSLQSWKGAMAKAGTGAQLRVVPPPEQSIASAEQVVASLEQLMAPPEQAVASPEVEFSTRLTPAVTPTPPVALPPGTTPTPMITSTPTVTPAPPSTPTPAVTPTPLYGGDTGFLDPSAQAADTGGDGDGFESSPTNAFADGGGFAASINGRGGRHRYYNYDISISPGCAISGIEVRLDWWLDSTFGSNSMTVELSWDGGTSWTAAKTDTQRTTSEHTAVLGGADDTWGRTWMASELSDANFRVRVTSNSSSRLRHFFLDWVPVKVYYSPSTPQLNESDFPTFLTQQLRRRADERRQGEPRVA